ncbi:MAG: hypothetical protein U1F35_11580 [Steroidobacteraceae bacterium]
MVIALAERDLLIRVTDAGADGGGRAEIEGRALHRAPLTGGDQPIIDGG